MRVLWWVLFVPTIILCALGYALAISGFWHSVTTGFAAFAIWTVVASVCFAAFWGDRP